jgi:hypothetical protein
MMRHLLLQRQDQVREAHYIWYVLLMGACGWASVLLLLDAGYKLITDWNVIFSPLFVLAEICQTVFMLTAAMLVGHDRFLHWVYYPRQLLIYYKLRRLNEQIQRVTHFGGTYNIPMPRFPTLSALEFANYRLFVMIMDSYRDLPEGSPLYLALAAIDQLQATPEETILQLQKLA